MKRNSFLSTCRSTVFCPLAAAMMIIAIGMTGCSLTAPLPPDSVHDATASQEHPPAAEVWRALANAVDAGTIDSTTRLAQCITVLVRNKDLSVDDVATFDAAFPSAVHDQRTLTNKDSALLRTLK